MLSDEELREEIDQFVYPSKAYPFEKGRVDKIIEIIDRECKAAVDNFVKECGKDPYHE